LNPPSREIRRAEEDLVALSSSRWTTRPSVLGGDTIRIYTHPHVTTRVIFMD
jgi:hypothetical protein